MEIYTQFKRPKTIPTNPGDGYLEEYQEQYNKKGEKSLVEIGKKDIYAMIQADLEQTKIENILANVARGDLEALNQRDALYFDSTTYPKTLMEAENLVLKGRYEFERMPEEVRKLFNNSADQYMSEMGTKEFLNKMAPYNKKMSEIAEAGSMKEYNDRVIAQAKFEKDVAAAKEGSNEQKQ